jgi:hypothetical protein
VIDHYRDRLEAYSRDPADAVVGAGFNGLYVAKNSQDGIAAEIPGLAADLHRESVELFVSDVVPALRASYPSRVWA